MIGSEWIDDPFRDQMRARMTNSAGEFVEFTSKAGPLHSVAAPVLDGLCGLRGA